MYLVECLILFVDLEEKRMFCFFSDCCSEGERERAQEIRDGVKR